MTRYPSRLMRLLFPIVAFFLFLWGLLYMRDNAERLLFWSYLLVAPCLLAALIDVVENRVSVERVPYLYSKYLYQIVTMLLLVLLPIPILFLLGPVGLFSVVVMAADLLFGILPSLVNDEPVRPALCAMAGIGETSCVPALTVYFTVYPLAVLAAVKWGTRIYDYLIELIARANPFQA